MVSAAGPQEQPSSAGHFPYPEVVSPDAPLQGTASLQVLSAGYLGRRFASTVTFVRDGAALIVVNPGSKAVSLDVVGLSGARLLAGHGAVAIGTETIQTEPFSYGVFELNEPR